MRHFLLWQSGFCSLAFLSASAATSIESVRVKPFWLNDGERAVQSITVKVSHTGSNTDGSFFFGGQNAGHFLLKEGSQVFDLNIPAREQSRTESLNWIVDEKIVTSTNVTLTPPRLRELWILPHSHVDIGYTDQQDKVVQVQIGNLKKGMDLARASASNAPGMRFKWNVEAAWTVDNFLHQATPAERYNFIQAVQAGQVEVDTLYANILTGLCQPEELAQSLEFGCALSRLTGTPPVSAMMCDVPGYTWGLAPMLAQAGVKYFVMGPNAGDRVGTIHSRDDKPFYWKSQSTRDRVLCWMVDNYHHNGNLEDHLRARIDKLERSNFPYDMAYMLWVGHWPSGAVDNAPPDEQLVEKVQAWNAKYAAPRVVIGLESEFFREFEQRHGAQIPEDSGDLTPYWEDGAASTARETALNRASGNRLAQASALFSMCCPEKYPAAQFDQAWKNEMLYSEHTWGAWCSISRPDDPFTLNQWKVKQNFAVQADKQSRQLLAAAVPRPAGPAASVDVFNTTQWPATGLATIPPNLAPAGMAGVTDARGHHLPVQHLSSGDWVFVAKNVPPFGAKRFNLVSQPGKKASGARAHGNVVENRNLRIELDPSSGAVKSLRLAGLPHEFVDTNAAVELNDFRYLPGTNTARAKRSGPVTISVLDSGPVVTMLRVDSDAPGCNHLTRDIRLVEGMDEVEFIDRVDRKCVREKDAVHFGFGFNVPSGTLHMETPWAVVRPNGDQLPGACRNWLPVQRWVDISGGACGVSWASLDAPLIEIGGMTANLLGSVSFGEWMTNALDSQTIYSWAQNNHWHTNYKIDQPGLTTFRFVLRPHRGGYSGGDSARFGIQTARPLIVCAANKNSPSIKSLLTVSPSSVVVETLKASEDGAAIIVRLFDASGSPQLVKLNWGTITPESIWTTDLTENPVKKMAGAISIPAYGILSLRAEIGR